MALGIGSAGIAVQSVGIATPHVENNMDQRDFEELAGRIEGLARAVLMLAQMMERETCMDGPTLSRQWRESVPPQSDEGSLGTARKTLHQMAQRLDDARSRHQESVRQARLADPSLLDRAAGGSRQSRQLPD